MRTLCTLQSTEVIQHPDGRIEFTADADIDADGSPCAYRADDHGADALRNAGYPHGDWRDILVAGPDGRPVTDPAGYFISRTAYEWPQFPEDDHRRYLDACLIPFIVISPLIRARAAGVVLGCRARVTHIPSGAVCEAMVGDIGPRYKIGELSVAAAIELGIPSSPRYGGEPDPVIRYELWPGTPAQLAGITYRLIPARFSQ
jgi:hypothetical protein